MKLIYSHVPPLKLKDGEYTLPEYMSEKLRQTNKILIAAGYASKKSLIELDRIVRAEGVRNVVLVLGMYYIEGFPESIYNTAMEIANGWKEDGIGEIRVTKSMKYHGKIYAFYNDNEIVSAIVGSHNLGALTVDANNMRQYEISICVEGKTECIAIDTHLSSVVNAPVSVPLESVDDVVIIHEENTKLTDVEGVTKISMEDVEAYKKARTDISFDIPLKVPGMPGSSQDFMKSNINKCYAKGRLNTRTGVVTERGWWETEVIVSSAITGNPNYPSKNVPFYVITDDGWKFKMHVSGDYSKNFESDGDLKILGYWIKGRLVAAGIVEPVDSPAGDLENKLEQGSDIYKNCKGVITFQKLQRYGKVSLTLTKTLNKLADDDGTLCDVWVLSFLPNTVK